MQKETLYLLFGLKISLLRQQQGMTYQQLAEKSNTTISYLSDIEKGKKYPSTEKIVALADALGIEYDQLVSIRGMKKLEPIVDLLESEFFRTFPLAMFGLQPTKIVEMLSTEPEKVNAFVSTVLKIARSYHMTRENLFSVALRSFQDMHDNYFVDLEKASQQFREEQGFGDQMITVDQLATVLQSAFGIQVDRKTISKSQELRKIRSYYSKSKKVLYLNEKFTSSQERFLMAREIAFQYLHIQNRPFETIILAADNFELLLQNFRASYFASALLMPELKLKADIGRCAEQVQWNGNEWLALLEKYDVSAEMLIQRFTNILPHHLGLKDLFFIRIEGNQALDKFTMTKELHLSGRQSPYATERGQQYCRRWISIDILRKMRVSGSSASTTVAAQISQYWQTENAYFCISMAKSGHLDPKSGTSVTLGILVNDASKRVFRFLDDPAITRKTVNVTCESCSIPDCMARAAAPIEIEREEELAAVKTALHTLD